MKRLIFLLLPLACILAGCKYDDSKIWEELEAQKAKIAALESLNSNVSSLQSIVSALQKNITVTAVTTNDKGHNVSFSDGTTVTILNADAATPKIGAKQDSDGEFYWTVGGNWLLDSNGNKVSTTGKTPKLKIDGEQWMVSYDDGSTWAKVDGQPSTVCLFDSVTTDADKAVFTLSDGSVITIPLAAATQKLQLNFDESVFAKMRDGEALNTSYTITAPENVTVDLQTFESDGWTVTIYPADERSGRFSIKAPEKVTPTKILFILTDSNGGSFIKIVHIDYNEEAKPAVQTEYVVDPEGGELVIPVSSMSAKLSEGASEWVEVKEVGDRVVLSLTPNESYDYRHVTVTLDDGTEIAIAQTTKDAIVLSSDVVEIDGRRQKVNFVVNTNVSVSAKVTEGSEWLSVTPATRGLVEKVFTFTASRNTSGEERTAKIEFTGGKDLSQTCTVIQAVYDGPDEIDVTEAIATEEGEELNLGESLVIALAAGGYMVSDGENAILVEDGTNTPAIGDKVKFGALSAVFNGITSLCEVEEFTTISSGNAVSYPTATNITGSVDSYSSELPAYVTVTGDLKVTDGTCTMTVPGATSKVVIYKPYNGLGISALDGHNVTVTGYYYGTTDGTLYIIAVKKTDNGSSVTEGTLVTVSQFIKLAREDIKLKLKGTVSNFNSQYCSFDLTDDSGKIYVYSVSNKSEWTDKIKDGGTVELLGFYKNYNSKDEVVNAEILSFTGGGGGGGTTTGYAYKKVTSVTSGKPYLIVALNDNKENMVAKPVTSNYGWLYVEKATEKDGTIALASRTNEFVFEEASSGYMIKQSDGRYLYQTGSYDNFNVNASPSDGQYWSVVAQSDGTFKITNTSFDKYMQYSIGFKSFGSYIDERGILPFLYEYVGETTIDGGGEEGGSGEEGGEGGGGSSDVTGSTETIDFSAQGYSNAQAISNFSGSLVSITFDKGTNSNGPKYYTTGTAIRLYGSNSMTISATGGKTVKGVTLTFSSGEGTNEITTNTGSYSDGNSSTNGSWTGSSSSVTFTIGGTSGHRRVKSIAVTVE